MTDNGLITWSVLMPVKVLARAKGDRKSVV